MAHLHAYKHMHIYKNTAHLHDHLRTRKIIIQKTINFIFKHLASMAHLHGSPPCLKNRLLIPITKELISTTTTKRPTITQHNSTKQPIKIKLKPCGQHIRNYSYTRNYRFREICMTYIRSICIQQKFVQSASYTTTFPAICNSCKHIHRNVFGQSASNEISIKRH